MDLASDKVYGTVLGVGVLSYVVWGKVSEYRFRKTAVSVTGRVIKRFPRMRYTSYYVAYNRAGTSRVAEYCGLPGRFLFDEGDAAEILIDPTHPPDTTVPDRVSSAGAPAGNCSLADERLFGFWDFFYVVASIGALAYAWWP